MSEMAYKAAKAVYQGTMKKAAGIAELARAGMNSGSAADCINNLKHMLEGERYTRTLNFYATRYYLTNIRSDFGVDALRRACAALELHLDYYDSLGHGRQVKLRKLLKDQLATLPPGPSQAERKGSVVVRPTQRTGTAKTLSARWGVQAKHVLYHKDGTWYHGLKDFPGALFDADGYILFETEEEFRRCAAVRPMPSGDLWVDDGISSISGYVRKTVSDAGQDAAGSAIETEMITHGVTNPTFIPDPEGRAMIRKHVTYERSRRNRAESIRFHGTKCKACLFDFNKTYGPTHAKDYIEVHHVLAVSEQADREIDPCVDLVPLCSNCHSMAHREHGRVLSVEELLALLAGGGGGAG
ncbi:MAG TPA: hypothetical protein DD417_06415 [Elusimicrobia bacterium]|nr:hypothetical protein [Elusimicrobiota bacterium]